MARLAGAMALIPGRCVLVRYPDQPIIWHERMVCAIVGDARHYVAMPDQELFPMTVMTLTCPPFLNDRRALPTLRRRREPYVRDGFQ